MTSTVSLKILETIENRYTCRHFSEVPIDKEIILNALEKIVEFAPSADNRQPYRFFILEKAQYLKVRRIIQQDWAIEAPFLVFLFSVPDEAFIRHFDGLSFDMIDAGIAFDHFILSMTESGLGTAWVGNADGKAIARALKLPLNWKFIAFTPVGYPMDSIPENRLRRRKEELVLTEPPTIKLLLR